jgi:hypothetical protein
MPAVQPVSGTVDRRNGPLRDALLRRVCGEFNEMPCLRLTRGQAQRLFGLRSDVCERVLADLVRDGILTYGSDERYRLSDSRWPTRTMFVHQGIIFPS